MHLLNRHVGKKTHISILGFFMLVAIISLFSYQNPNSATADIVSNLVGHWTFNEGSGTNVTDSSGTGNNGTFVNGTGSGISWVTGQVGSGALSFGGNGSHVLVSHNSTLNPQNDFTVSAWVKINNYGGNVFATILSKSTSNNGYWFAVDGNNNRLWFQFAGGSTYYSNSSVISTGDWYHVAFIRSGSTGIFYVNGIAQGSMAVPSGAQNSSSDLKIGILESSASGNLDDVRIYNRSLTLNEINALCNCQNDTTTPTISTIASNNVTTTSATITWNTDEDATSQVQYGITNSYGSNTTLDTNLVSNHSVNLTGLSAATEYHYRVISKDSSNNITYSSNQTFITASSAGVNTILQSKIFSGVYNLTSLTPITGKYLWAEDLIVSDNSWKVTDNTYYGPIVHGSIAQGDARNGQAVKLSGSNSSVIKFDFNNLSKGVYFIRIIGRVNQGTISRIVKPVFVNFTINDGPNGETSNYRVKVLYTNKLQETGRIFFNALNTNNNLHGEISLDVDSQEDLLVHRIDFFSALYGVPITKVKTSVTTFTNEERNTAIANEISNPSPYLGNLLGAPGSMTTAERLSRDDTIWSSLFPLNVMNLASYYEKNWIIWPGEESNQYVDTNYGTWSLDTPLGPVYYRTNNIIYPWKMINTTLNLEYTYDDFINHRPLPGAYPFKDEGFGVYFTTQTPVYSSPSTYKFIIAPFVATRLAQYSGTLYDNGGGGGNLAYRYYLNNDTGMARDASLAMVRLALQYPTFQMEAQDLFYNSDINTANDHWGGARLGKIQYNGWESRIASGYLRAYEYLFDYINGNQELADAVHRYIPWVITSNDVIALIDTYLINNIYYEWQAGRISFSDPLLLGLVLQHGTIANNLMDISKTNMSFPPNGNATIKRHYRTSLNQDGATNIGSMYYTGTESGLIMGNIDYLQRFKDNGGTPVYDLSNLTLYPKFIEYAKTFTNLTVAGGYEPSFGDAADFIYQGRRLRAGNFPIMWKYGGNNTKAAWYLKNVFGRTNQSNSEWSAINTDANTITRDPRLSSESRVFNGLGLGILEAGVSSDDYRDKTAIILKTGVGAGHAHADALDLNLYALGLRMATDYGTRNEGNLYSIPSSGLTYSHNTVEVDGLLHPWRATANSWPGGNFDAQDAWINSFAPGEISQYISGQALSNNHTNVNVYDRNVSLIDINDTNSYVFDVFRVGGGQLHTWTFHGADTSGETGGLALNVGTSTSLDSDTSNYMRKHASPTQGVATNKLEAIWRLGRTSNNLILNNGEAAGFNVTTVAAEQSMLGIDYNANSPRKYTKVTLFGHAGDKVLTGNIFSEPYHFSEPQLYLQSGNTGTFNAGTNKQSVYPSIIEAYAGTSLISSSDSLSVIPNENDALRAVALNVVTTNGNNDTIISDGRNSNRTIGDLNYNARFGYYSKNNNDFRMMKIVGGTNLTNGLYSLKPTNSKVSSTISSVDYINRKIYTTSPITTTLIGRDFHIYNNDHKTSYKIINIAVFGNGSVLTYEKPADIAEMVVDSVSGYILASSENWSFYENANRNSGYTATNESGSKVFKIASDYWGNHTISTNSLIMSDFPDTDADGAKQIIVYDFGYGDIIEVETNVAMKFIGSDIFSMNNDVDTYVTLPGAGLSISNDQINWTNLATTINGGGVTALIPGSTTTRYIKITGGGGDTMAPVRSLGLPSTELPVNTTQTNISLVTNENATCKYSTSSGSIYSSMTAFSTTGGTSHSSTISNLENGNSYIYHVKCQDSFNNTNTGNYNISFSVAVDTNAPIISNLSVGTPTNTSAIIAWTTDKASSSQIEYGLINTLGFLSSLDSNLVTSHSFSLSNLLSCSRYHFRVKSRDVSSNLATSIGSRFFTRGCTGSAEILDDVSSLINSSGGNLDLLTSGKGLRLIVPSTFLNNNNEAYFQIKKLEKNAFTLAIANPPGKTLIGDYIYNLRSISNNNTNISSFDKSLTTTMFYNDSDISGINESSLKIQRYNGSVWNELPNCFVDTTVNSVTCDTSNFSDFALFGEVQVTGSGGGGAGGFSRTTRVQRTRESRAGDR